MIMNKKLEYISIACLILLAVVFISTVSNVMSQTEGLIYRDWNTEKYQNSDGTVSLIIYSGLRNVLDIDGEWKRIEDAKSLKPTLEAGKIIINYSYDGVHNATIDDFNLTHIDFILDFDKDKIIGSEYEYEYEEDKLKTKFKYGDVEYEIEIEDDEKLIYSIDGNPFANTFHFGRNSTTIQIMTPDTGNLQDTFVDEAHPTTKSGSQTYLHIQSDEGSGNERHPLLKFNLTELYSLGSITIDDSQLYFYIYGNTLDASTEGWLTPPQKIYTNFTVGGSEWTEDNVDWNTKPNSSYLNTNNQSYIKFFGGAGEPSGGYYNLTVTDYVNESFLDSDLNVSFYLPVTDTFGSPSSDIIYIYSKDFSNTRPYLNITYSVPAVTTTSSTTTVSCTCPASGDWHEPCSNNCVMSDNICNVSGKLILDGTGTFTMENYSITYIGRIHDPNCLLIMDLDSERINT